MNEVTIYLKSGFKVYFTCDTWEVTSSSRDGRITGYSFKNMKPYVNISTPEIEAIEIKEFEMLESSGELNTYYGGTNPND